MLINLFLPYQQLAFELGPKVTSLLHLVVTMHTTMLHAICLSEFLFVAASGNCKSTPFSFSFSSLVPVSIKL